MKNVSISIISHNHGKLLLQTITSLTDALVRADLSYEILLTINVPEKIPGKFHNNKNIVIIQNSSPKGFGANHNQAHKLSKGEYFIVCNPDIEVPQSFNFRSLLHECPDFGVLSPIITSISGAPQEFLRHDITVKNFIRRRLGYPEVLGNRFMWLAGVFLVFTSFTYQSLDGFDEDYFMYVEDADICRKIWYQNGDIIVSQNEMLAHHAQHASHRTIKHTYWHIKSLFIYWSKNWVK